MKFYLGARTPWVKIFFVPNVDFGRIVLIANVVSTVMLPFVYLLFWMPPKMCILPLYYAEAIP